MDFSYLSNLSHDRQTKDSGKRHRILPASKQHNPSSKVAASAVQQFLARKQEEVQQKYEEFRKRKEQLLSLRSQNSKNNKKAKLMASRTRDNDFSRIRLTEEEEEAKASREKELQRKGLSSKVDRMKARIELEERDSNLPRKRKRKSHISNSDELQSDISATNTFVKVEQKVNNSGICQKNEVDKKIFAKPKPAPLIGYKDLLHVAAKKQFEPIPIPDEDFEDFEEDSDEYEEGEADSVSAEKLPNQNLQQYNSLKENRALERQHGTSDKRVKSQEERLDKSLNVNKSKQNKENTYRNRDHNSSGRLNRPSGEHDRKAHSNSECDTSLLQSSSLRNNPDSSALHGKENQTTYGRETHASKKIHSHSYKHHYDRDISNAERNMDISRRNDISKPSNLIKEERKTSVVPSLGKIKYQNSSVCSQLPSAEDRHSGMVTQKRKHEETFRNSIKGLPDRRNSVRSTEYSKNDQKAPSSVLNKYLKKDGEAISVLGNTHSDSLGHKKVESHSFRIPKKSSNKAKSPQDDRPSYYTNETSNSFEDVKQSSAKKIANVKSSDNHVSKSGKNVWKEKLEKKPLHYDKTNKSHTKFNYMNEEVTKGKHVNETSNHAASQNSDRKGKEKSCSRAPEKTLLNRSDKVYNSDEYFTQGGQKNHCHKSSVEKNSSKNRLKERNKAASSHEVSQYFTEEFTVGESKGKTGDSKHHSSKNLNYDKGKTKDSHSSMKAHGNSSQTTGCTKSHKYEKSKVQESQYFTEDFVENQNNVTNINSKHGKKTTALQAERQSSHSQYFTENFATDRPNIEKSSKKSNYKCDKKRISSQQDEKQSQYFTESFESNVARKNDKKSSASQKESQYFTEEFVRAESSRTKSNENGSRYDRKTSLPPKERNEPQYFTEHYTNKKSEAKESSTNCKYDRRTVPHAKESHYYTEKFSTSETKVSNDDFTFDFNKRTSLPKKEKQRDHSQYFNRKSYMDESDNRKRSDDNSKSGKRFTGSNKEKQAKPVQYFTESFTFDGHHLTKTGRNQSHQHARNGTTTHMEKGKNNRPQSRSKVEEYVPTKIAKTVEEYTPGEISGEVEEYIPTKITNKVEEYIPQKILNKENLPERSSDASYHSSDSHSERHKKTTRHSYKSDEVRIPKRPRENLEDEMYPSKVCRYENSGSTKADASNFRKDKSLANHSAEKSKSTLNHSKTHSEKKKQPMEASKSKEKINYRTNTLIQSSKIASNEHKVNQKEKVTSNSHLNNKLNGSHERIHKLELSPHKKPSGKLPSEKQDNMKKLPAANNNSSLLKSTMPPKDRKIIPASSMAQMMNKKLLQSKSSLETVSANNQNSEARKTNEKKSLVNAKRTVHQTKSEIAPFYTAKADPGKSIPPKHRDSKPSAPNHKKVDSSSSQRAERKDVEHSMKPIEGSHRSLEKKPVLNLDRRVKREEYESKVRNRFPRPSPRMFIKRNMESDDDEEEEDEEDDDMSDFIDDGPIDEDEEDYSHYIREIFGYDKRRYRFEDDFDDRDMETSYAQQMKEERRSARIGYLEDLEDIRKEEEEKTRKANTKKVKQ